MGNPFAHMELTTADPAAARKFYKKVFDWKLNVMGPDMGNYTLIDTGDKVAGGGVTAPMMPGQPTAWMPYALVESVKKTIGKAEKHGAKILVPLQAIPGNGAIGVFVDPTGAAFGVWEKEKKSAAKKAKKEKGKKKGKKEKK